MSKKPNFLTIKSHKPPKLQIKYIVTCRSAVPQKDSFPANCDLVSYFGSCAELRGGSFPLVKQER